MTEAEFRAEMGRKGGLARAAKMSKRARKKSAMKANRARWDGNSHNRRKQKRAAKMAAK